VVMTDAATHIAGQRPAADRALPAGVLGALNAQTGLALTLETASAAVYANVNFHGLYSAINPKTGRAEPILNAASPHGFLAPGVQRVTVGLAPASAFALDINGHPATRSTSFGWAPTYVLDTGAKTRLATVSLHQFPLNGLLALFTLGMWLVIWLGFGWIQRLEWLFTGRRPRYDGETV